MTPDSVDNGGSESRRPDPWPTLTAEWRLHFWTASGFELVVAADSEADARWRGERVQSSTWQVERRWVSPWDRVGKTIKTTTTRKVVASPTATSETED